MKRLLICGSRNFGFDAQDKAVFENAMLKWLDKHGRPEVVIEGGARGADTLGKWWAESFGITVEEYPAKWENGKRAGYDRNRQMLVEGKPDAIIAFSRDLATSKGTKMMVELGVKAGVPVWVPIPQPQQELGL